MFLMSKLHFISSLFLFAIVTFSASVLAADEPQPKPIGKELLIAVATNKYPAEPLGHDCEEFIPAFSKLKVDGGCRSITKTAPQIAFIGDSHVAHYRPSALSELQLLSPIVISQTECFPFTTDAWREKKQGDATCGAKQIAVLDYLSKANSVKTVVLSSRWSALMSGPDFERSGDGWLKMTGMSAEDKRSFIANGQKFIATLLKAGKKVVLMRDIPDLDFKPETCYNIRPVRLGKTEVRQDCSMAQATFEPRRQLQNVVLDEMLKPYTAVKVYDPVPLFCQVGRCKASDGTLPYYLEGGHVNSDHVNNFGAQFVFKDFVPKFFPELNPATKVK